MPLNLTAPLSLYSIPAVWATSFYPAVWKTMLITITVGLDNVQPRQGVQRFDAIAKKKDLSSDMLARLRKLDGAHQNGNEAFPLWCAAILVGNYAKLDNYTLNVASLAYVGLRLLYNFVYINQKTQAQGHLRTLLWFTGLSLPLYILVSSANKLSSA